MRLAVSLSCALALLASIAPTIAQGGMPAAEVAVPAEAAEIDPVDLMRQLGAGEKEVMMFQLMANAMGGDMAQMMLTMMLADEMGMDDDMFGFLLFAGSISPRFARSRNRGSDPPPSAQPRAAFPPLRIPCSVQVSFLMRVSRRMERFRSIELPSRHGRSWSRCRHTARLRICLAPTPALSRRSPSSRSSPP